MLTPYEKNLEFWRQLWRVVERSDVVIQIVDARNPLLFRCEDLEKYVKEVSESKLNLILVNKADFLSDEQRQHWADYFENIGVKVAFFSAYLASLDTVDEEEHDNEESDTVDEEEHDNEESSDTVDDEEEHSDKEFSISSKELSDFQILQESVNNLETAVEKKAQTLDKIIDRIEGIMGKPMLKEPHSVSNSSKLFNREEFIELLKTVHTGSKVSL